MQLVVFDRSERKLVPLAIFGFKHDLAALLVESRIDSISFVELYGLESIVEQGI